MPVRATGKALITHNVNVNDVKSSDKIIKIFHPPGGVHLGLNAHPIKNIDRNRKFCRAGENTGNN